MELLFAIIVALVIWYFWGPRRRKPAEPSPISRDFRPDPLTHLDVKPSDRSITQADLTPDTHPAPQPGDYEFEIVYRDKAGNVTTRRIAWASASPDGADTMIRAYCGNAQAERTFRSSRILSCRNIHTGRGIKDLGRYLRRQ